MAIQEAVILNGLSLNPAAGNFAVEAIDFTPPKKKPEWAQSADGDGADLVRTPLFENRVITATVRITPQASMDLALAKMGELVDQLQEAEKNPGGIPLEWTPANSTKTITFYVLTGEVTGVPVVAQGTGEGWFVASPMVTISMTCKPFGYGAEVEAAAVKSIETGLSVVVLTVPTLAGDVPAEGRLVVKDTAAVGRRFVEWGLENRYYNAATSLILDSEDMTPVGGAQIALGGAYKRAGAVNGAIRTTLLPEPTICCNTGVLKHVGTFRVKARVVMNSTNSKARMRLSWQDGEGPLRANAWQTPPANSFFSEVDLGNITITPAILGTQKWLGQIEAYSENTAAADTLAVDYLTFIPVLEGYGKARGVQSSAPGTVVAYDNFTTGTLSGNLNTRTPAVGAAWATSGAATDWTVESGKIKRATATDAEPRFGVIGAAQGNSSIQIAGEMERPASSVVAIGAILRWVNATNYAFVLCEAEPVGVSSTKFTCKVGVVVAAATTILTTSDIGRENAGGVFAVTASLAATLDGALTTTMIAGKLKSITVSGSHASIATGGALASGKGGIYDRNQAAANTRTFTLVNVATLAAIPYCVQPSRTMEVHSDSTLAADSTGTYFGPVPLYRGSRFYVPQKGSAGRTSRIIVKADRNDLQESDQSTIADAFTGAVFATPRYLAIPR